MNSIDKFKSRFIDEFGVFSPDAVVADGNDGAGDILKFECVKNGKIAQDFQAVNAMAMKGGIGIDETNGIITIRGTKNISRITRPCPPAPMMTIFSIVLNLVE
jgi:hypothetical protein